MAIDITVLRDGGAYQGEDIVDSLLSTVSAALERGRHELNANAKSLQPINLTVPYDYALRTGKVVQLVDTDSGEVSYGKIQGVSHSFNFPEATTSLTIELASDFSVAI
jgi:ABC-type transporter Mla subunit MlaD